MLILQIKHVIRVVANLTKKDRNIYCVSLGSIVISGIEKQSIFSVPYLRLSFE